MATFLTIRAVFERCAILKLLEEPEFKDNLHAGVIRSNRILSDHYFAILVLASQPQEDGSLLLRVVFTTLVGIQYSTKTMLFDQGVYHAAGEHHIVAETLRAHFRAAQEDPWTKTHFPTEFVIRDLDFEDLEQLFDEG